jgi:hypothetical protein
MDSLRSEGVCRALDKLLQGVNCTLLYRCAPYLAASCRVTPGWRRSLVGAFEPSEVHGMLRAQVRQFAEAEVDSQANDFNRDERFNRDLFRKLGAELGIIGITVTFHLI